MPDTHFLAQVLILLAAAVTVVALFGFARISPLLGYIAAGAVVGPHGFALIQDDELIRGLAELGVVFLLFTVGLELSFQRLKSMRRLIFGLGLSQVVVTALVLGLLAWLLGAPTNMALLLGFALALSSTAIVLRLLVERGEQSTRFGRTALAVLLFQDLAVVPLLVLVPLVGDESGTLLDDLAGAGFKAVVALVAIVIVGRLALRFVLSVIARAGGEEVVMIAALLIILGTAAITEMANLSLALGAFLAGVLIAETEFRHQIEAEITPFRGVLLGLFFMTIGMTIDFQLVLYAAGAIMLCVLGLIMLKAVLLAGLCRLAGLPPGLAVRTGLSLSQGGEFALIVLGLMLAYGLMDNATVHFLIAVIVLSMAATPLLTTAGRYLGEAINRRQPDPTGELVAEAGDLQDHVVIAGFGRVGHTVGRMLADQDVPFIGLDLNAHRVRDARQAGLPVFYGDASRMSVLHAAGIERARAAVITLDTPPNSTRAVKVLRDHMGDILIYARARDASDMARLEAVGASVTVPETLEASLQLGGQVLRCTGTPESDIDRIFDEFRDESYNRLTTEIESIADDDQPKDKVSDAP